MSKQLQRSPSAAQQERDLWLQHLQRRVMLLLLRYDQKLFQGQFRTFYVGSRLPTLPLLQFYDRHLKLQLFSAELLDDIMPHVRTQWSLETSQLALSEEAPVRGEIDWPRTIERTLSEAPDQPPLRFETYLHQRSMHIPENVLVVAILLRYRQLVQATLSDDQREEMLSRQERQQLVGIDERLERELATPYTRPLIADARKADLETLISQVRAQLRPGGNPYRDLIAWWEQVRALYIGATGNAPEQQRHLTLLSKRRDAQMAQWLYELWVALELLSLLQETPEAQLRDVEVHCDQLRWSFTWQERRFHFHFQRQLSPINEGEVSAWENIPVSRPNFAITREQPLKVEHKGILIWQEPPFTMSAVYPASEQAEVHLGEAIQRLLGLMQVQRTLQGALCCPIMAEPEPDQPISGIVRPDENQYVDSASVHISLTLYKLTPDLPIEQLQERLRALLNQAIICLPERAAPACHGFVLDADSVNASSDRVQDYNIVCPKPHIGPGIFDLVHRDRHCLQDPRVCHVIDKEVFLPSVSRNLNLEDLEQQIRRLCERNSEELEQVKDEDSAEIESTRVLAKISNIIQQYVKFRGGNTLQQEKYFRRVFGGYWEKQARCLSSDTRNMLLSGEYVWDEYQNTELKDWAAPAVQYCRALEREIKRRVYDYYPRFHNGRRGERQRSFDRELTLGTVETIVSFKDKDLRNARSGDYANKIASAQRNWALFEEITRSSGANPDDLEEILWRMVNANVAQIRNRLAHGEHIERRDAEKLRDIILGENEEIGILHWLVGHLDPKQ